MRCSLHCSRWILPVIVWAIFIFMAVGIVLYALPRKTIDIEFIKTSKSQYKTGEIIIATVEADVIRKGFIDNGVYLLCGNSRYFLKEVSYTVPDGQNTIITVPMGAVPADVFPPDCKIQVDVDYTVQVLPFLHRTYEQTVFSNQFKVTN